jgi:hypothetical protein
LPGYRYNKPEIRFNEPLFGLLVALLYSFGQFYYFIRRDPLDSPNFLQIKG